MNKKIISYLPKGSSSQPSKIEPESIPTFWAYVMTTDFIPVRNCRHNDFHVNPHILVNQMTNTFGYFMTDYWKEYRDKLPVDQQRQCPEVVNYASPNQGYAVCSSGLEVLNSHPDGLFFTQLAFNKVGKTSAMFTTVTRCLTKEGKIKDIARMSTIIVNLKLVPKGQDIEGTKMPFFPPLRAFFEHYSVSQFLANNQSMFKPVPTLRPFKHPISSRPVLTDQFSLSKIDIYKRAEVGKIIHSMINGVYQFLENLRETFPILKTAEFSIRRLQVANISELKMQGTLSISVDLIDLDTEKFRCVVVAEDTNIQDGLPVAQAKVSGTISIAKQNSSEPTRPMLTQSKL